MGEFAVVQPLSMEYSCILGYLLAWKLLLTFFKSSPTNVRTRMLLLLWFSVIIGQIVFIVMADCNMLSALFVSSCVLCMPSTLKEMAP